MPGDPSSAAFPLVAALITPGSEVTVEGVLLNPLRTGLFETLREMGADLAIDNRARGRRRAGRRHQRRATRRSRASTVPAERAPSMIDEYPILAVAAAFAEGRHVMRGIGELRVKESDRIAADGRRASRPAASASRTSRRRVIVARRRRASRGGGLVATHGDHRIAMAFLVLGLAADEAGHASTSPA